MKTILLLCAVMAIALVVAPFGAAQGKKMKETKAYVCAKCDMASMKAGKCACGSETMMMSGRTAYVCDHCHTSSTKAGKCMKCQMPMKKSFITYECEHCKTSAGMAGNCKKCNMPMKKHVVPMAN